MKFEHERGRGYTGLGEIFERGGGKESDSWNLLSPIVSKIQSEARLYCSDGIDRMDFIPVMV